LSDRLPPPASRLPALARLESLGLRGVKLGLSAIGAVCERLGRPERRFPSALVGGTNGKGSTAATLSAIAGAHGLRCGLYTSPHLVDVTERVRLEERDVSPEELDDALARVFDAAGSAPEIAVTYFEAVTAAAFVLFAARPVELAVLEVGLGGRLDATNVAPAILSAITSIGLDHTEDLGETLPEIAREKAGIFRRGRPALARASDPEALEVLSRSAIQAGALWHDAGREISVEVARAGVEGTRFAVATPERSIELDTPLPGEHQAWNSALAVRAAELLGPTVLRPDSGKLAAGVRSVRWPGRLESFRAAGRTILLDGCHNTEGAEALARFLRDAGLAGRCRLVFGAMADKDVEGIAARLFPLAASVTLVTAPSPRAASASELARRVPRAPGGVAVGGDVSGALSALLGRAERAPIIVAGSLYLVGEARSWLLAAVAPEGTR
jgi:dihydrofolate synthase / folylpolyglutamate synthase